MKKRTRFLLITLLLIGGGIISVAGYEQIKLIQNKNIVKKFTSDISRSKFDEAADYITLPSNVDKKNVIQKYKNIFSGIQLDNVSIKNIQVKKLKNQTYSFSYQLSGNTPIGKLKNIQYKGTLHNNKIEWNYNLIFPNMKFGDKVKFEIDPGERGEIIDRNGKLLAGKQKVLELGIIPNDLGHGKTKEKRLKFISSNFDISIQELNQILNQKWVTSDTYVPIKILDNKEYKNMPNWISITPVDGRYYPLGKAAAQLIGYTGEVTADDLKKHPELTSNSRIGRSGLEYTFDKQLQGHDGGRIIITEKDGNPKYTLLNKKKRNGKTIKLTIDSEAQKIAYKSLKNKPGCIVANNPKNGELLVLASSPSYDPNKMNNGISSKEYKKYTNDKNLPFTSRFATGYAPGSTFKMITAVIGLDNKTIQPDKSIAISGLKWQPNPSWGGYYITRVSDQPEVNLRTALVYSDNIYMAQQALKMGSTKFLAGLHRFIFGENLSLPIDMLPAQISHNGKLDSDILLADTGYGQGELLITPIQQISMYTIFPNNGTLVYPKLLFTEKTKIKPNVAKKESVQLVNNDLKDVISDPNGTAHTLDRLDMSLAGKTGTAEIKMKQDTRGKQNSFLFAFNPNKRTYSILSFLEDKKDNESATDLSIELLNYLDSHY